MIELLSIALAHRKLIKKILEQNLHHGFVVVLTFIHFTFHHLVLLLFLHSRGIVTSAIHKLGACTSRSCYPVLLVMLLIDYLLARWRLIHHCHLRLLHDLIVWRSLHLERWSWHRLHF